MTKYILHGGEALRETSDNQRFFVEIAKDLPSKANILFVPFARKKDLWNDLMKQTKQRLSLAAPDKHFTFIQAAEDPSFFPLRASDAEAVYLLGGNTEWLLDYFKRIPQIETHLSGKTVAGTSAGAQLFCKHFYYADRDEYWDGLGILKVKVIVHWSEEKIDKFNVLEAYGEKLEIIKLPEEKFVVVHK